MSDLDKHRETASAETAFAEKVLSLAKGIVVTDAETLSHAEEIVKNVKEHWKRIETQRKELSAPAWNLHRSIQAFFSPPLEKLSQAEMHLKGEIARHTRETQARAIAAMQEVSKGADIVIPPPAELSKGVSVRKVQKWSVTEPDKVPKAFCSPDAKKIQAHLDAGGLEAIPGVRFFEDEIVTVRT
jgi:hypothetical protein